MSREYFMSTTHSAVTTIAIPSCVTFRFECHILPSEPRLSGAMSRERPRVARASSRAVAMRMFTHSSPERPLVLLDLFGPQLGSTNNARSGTCARAAAAVDGPVTEPPYIEPPRHSREHVVGRCPIHLQS
jgi:hypothetical protein